MKLEGRTIGQIRIDKLVGEGGMGAVYRGHDLRLDRAVAVKTLHDRYLDDPVGRARFLREAQILSRLDHPGICKVYGIVRHDDADLLVLEWLEGASLGDVMRDASFERRLELAIETADALSAAHRQQIVHRDLKPDNVIVTRDGVVKVLDFGIARSAEPAVGPAFESRDEESVFFEESDLDSTWPGGPRRTAPPKPGPSAPPGLTVDGNTVGTIAYMSPEQVGGLPLGVASDAYSFGILLQEMFTGRRAYDEVQPIHLMSLVVVGKTRPLGDLDPQLAELIHSLQSLDESERPSLQEAAERLRRLRDAPERRRRRALRRAAVATVFASLLLGVAAVIHGRLEAVRSAAEARDLTRLAAEAEWLMRAEHLAPPHDLRPAREQVRRMMAELEARSRTLDARGRAAGRLALGRAAMALGEVDAAVDHLQAAWEAGLRDGEAAASFGLALAEQVRRQMLLADRQTREGERLRLREQALAGRDRARELLRQATAEAGADSTTTRLARAHLATLEENWDEALRHAAEASAASPWFYEGHLLAATVLQQRMLVAQLGRGEASAAAAYFRDAQESLDRAGRVGRSDPEVPLTRCSLIYDAFVGWLYSTEPGPELDYETGIAACEEALALDAENGRGHLFKALLLARGAELYDQDDRERLLARSIESAHQAVTLSPSDAEAWRALAMGNMVRADFRAMRGGDPEEALEATIEACRQGLALAPRDIYLLNLLGNAEGVRTEMAWARGESPLEPAARASDAYRRAIEVGEDSPHLVSTYPRTNLAIQQEVAVRWLATRPDLDPRPLADEGLEHARAALAVNEKNGHAWTAVANLSAHVADWLLDRGDAASAGRRVEEAVEAAERAVSSRNDGYALEARTRAQTQAARLAFQTGDPAAAEASATAAVADGRRLLEDDPRFVEGWLVTSLALDVAAELAAARGDAANAREHAQEALDAAAAGLDVDPDHVPLRNRRHEATQRMESLRPSSR